MRTRNFLFALSSVVVLAAGACGGDDTSPATGADGGSGEAGTLEDGATGTDTGSSGGSDSSSGGVRDSGGVRPGGESWIWVFTEYGASLNAINANKASFTHVSPAFYSLNYAYKSGMPYYANCKTGGGNFICTDPGSDNFDGMTSAQLAKKVGDMGLAIVPLIYAGADNGGTDEGMVALLDNAGAQSSFITAMVNEAVAKNYNGYNLDLELALGNSYADKFIAFTNAFKAELSKHGMSLSVDVISANIHGTFCSGNDGVFDLAKLQASAMDRVILEDYGDKLGGPSSSCQKKTVPISCPDNVIGFYDIMCTFMTSEKIVIGFDSVPQFSNPVAGPAISAMRSYGFTKVALWPDTNNDGPGGSYAFLDTKSINPAGSTWYGLLQQFLAP
jgi:hypothetical protein